jgi:uncharacterized repeat protein (TIGR01451 family)
LFTYFFRPFAMVLLALQASASCNAAGNGGSNGSGNNGRSGATIVNYATATYTDGKNREYLTQSSSGKTASSLGAGPQPVYRIALTMNADRPTVQPGDLIGFTIALNNTSGQQLSTTQITDTLPPGMLYAPHTARLDGILFEPVNAVRSGASADASIVWSLSALPNGVSHTITYTAIVFPSVGPNTSLTNQAAAAATVAGAGSRAGGASAVTVVVVGGAFSQRYPITGRVFIAYKPDEHFTRGDSGVPSVRIYLEDGSSVATDSDGRFSFPAARPGMHVLRLDPTTLPKGAHSFPDQRMNSTHALQQLAHGILDDGIIEDIEFALEPIK